MCVNILQCLKVSDIPNIVMCHSCRLQPSIIAHFDFILPEQDGTASDNSFLVVMEMTLAGGRAIFGTHVEKYPVSSSFFKKFL